MKKKFLMKSIFYLITMIIMIALFVIGYKILSNYIEESKLTFHRNAFFIKGIYITFFGSIGILLGLDKLLSQLKNDGRIKFNISKLLFWGIPLILIILIDVSMWFNLIPELDVFSNYILILSSLILGYTFISSIEKY